MTEAEWLTCADPTPMLEFVLGEPVYEEGCEQMPDSFEGTSYPSCRVSDRKLRLYAVGCHRRLWGLLKDERSRRAIEVAELYADGVATESELRAADRDADEAFRISCVIVCWKVAGEAARGTLVNCATGGYDYSFKFWTWRRRREEARHAHCELLRDVVGNLFCPVAVDPSWLTFTVLALARQMYGSRDFSAMPILADALMDAGCDNDDILNHCRQPGEHVRGCWVLDLVLGKK